MEPLKQQNFRGILKSQLELRSSRNPRYSMRSFARDIGLSPARLSDVLRERYGLSKVAAKGVAERLGFNAQETNHFCDLVESQHARSGKLRESARRRIASSPREYQQVSEDLYEMISDIHHFALLELALVKGFRSQTRWIARQLGISELTAESAVSRLLRLGMLQKDETGKLKPSNGFTSTSDGVPSSAIKSSHRQLLAKASAAVDFQKVAERDLSGVILAIDSSQLQDAKDMIKAFRREFDARFSSAENKDKVYCLGVQFFSLQESGEPI